MDTQSKLVRAGSLERFKNSDNLSINWNLTNLCNYNCSYCMEHRLYNGKLPTWENILRATDYVKSLKRQSYRFTISGGEPTLHPDLCRMLKHICEEFGPKVSILVNTNLGRSINYFSKFVKELGAYCAAIGFYASAHMERFDHVEFAAKIKLLDGHGFRVVAHLLAHPLLMPAAKRIQEFLCKNAPPRSTVTPPCLVLEMQGNIPDLRYKQEDIKWIKKQTSLTPGTTAGFFLDHLLKEESGGKICRSFYSRDQMVLEGLNKFKGMICNAGFNLLAIDQNGGIVPAVCFRAIPNPQNVYYGPRPTIGHTDLI